MKKISKRQRKRLKEKARQEKHKKAIFNAGIQYHKKQMAEENQIQAEEIKKLENIKDKNVRARVEAAAKAIDEKWKEERLLWNELLERFSKDDTSAISDVKKRLDELESEYKKKQKLLDKEIKDWNEMALKTEEMTYQAVKCYLQHEESLKRAVKELTMAEAAGKKMIENLKLIRGLRKQVENIGPTKKVPKLKEVL